MRAWLIVAALAASLHLATATLAQTPAGFASLVADAVRVEADQRLVAEGHVEVLYADQRLRATRIVYDRATDQLQIEGPITLTDGSGNILLADTATLSGDLRQGLLAGARLVLDQQLQLAAQRIQRIDGRYTRLERTVASSCQVCASNPTPLWEIRAARVTHDQQERQLYFDNATLRVVGVPVFYVPRLRMPDPTLDRATGFLPARLRTNSVLGTGVKVPYFIALGDHADLTATPYLSTSRTTTLELRYRQAFAQGTIEANGALSRDNLLPGQTRGYVFAEGDFVLPSKFKLHFDLQNVSDDAYLSDYSYSDTDRLKSGVEITRTRRNEFIRARVLSFHSLRASDNNATLPSMVGDLTFHRRFKPKLLGGEGGLRFQLHGHQRSSSYAFDGPDADTDTDGRDMARASARLDWRRNWILPAGVVASAMAEISADLYAISDDAAYTGSVARIAPVAAVELRWPLVRHGGGGMTDTLEPVVQLVWSRDDNHDVPNDDSVLVEFDEGNLFAPSRYPGSDRIETGRRLNIGLGWTRTSPSGWSLGVAAGRVLRAGDDSAFTTGTGLDGRNSDWLTAVHLTTGNGLSLINRAIFDNSFSLARNETRLGWENGRLDLATSLIWLDADPAVGLDVDTAEWSMDAAYQLTDLWRGRLAWRYDVTADRATWAAIGLRYRNECINVDLSLSRRFTSSTSVRPTTDFGLSIDLVGFGSGGGAAPIRRGCAG